MMITLETLEKWLEALAETERLEFKEAKGERCRVGKELISVRPDRRSRSVCLVPKDGAQASH